MFVHSLWFIIIKVPSFYFGSYHWFPSYYIHQGGNLMRWCIHNHLHWLVCHLKMNSDPSGIFSSTDAILRNHLSLLNNFSALFQICWLKDLWKSSNHLKISSRLALTLAKMRFFLHLFKKSMTHCTSKHTHDCTDLSATMNTGNCQNSISRHIGHTSWTS